MFKRNELSLSISCHLVFVTQATFHFKRTLYIYVYFMIFGISSYLSAVSCTVQCAYKCRISHLCGVGTQRCLRYLYDY